MTQKNTHTPKNHYKSIVIAVTLLICLTWAARVHYDFLFTDRTYTEDISVANSYRNNKPYDVYLVTYADGGEVHFRNQNTLAQTAINKGFDHILMYSTKNLDKKFVKKNKAILSAKRGAGYWAWKPYVILDAMKKANENDVIIYLDSGMILTSKLKTGIDFLLRDVESFDKDIILFANDHTMRPHTKRDLLDHLNMNTDVFKDKIQLDAAFIIFKNSQESRKFVTAWLALCEQEKLISDKPSLLEEDPKFVDHRHDQAILSLLAYKHEDKVQIITTNRKNLIKHHRRRDNKKDKTLFKKLK